MLLVLIRIWNWKKYLFMKVILVSGDSFASLDVMTAHLSPVEIIDQLIQNLIYPYFINFFLSLTFAL